MDIERHDGTRERRTYHFVEDMMRDAEIEALNPTTKKLILHFPKSTIPKKRGRR